MILTKFLESKDWIRGLNFGIKTSVDMSNLKLFEANRCGLIGIPRKRSGTFQ
jgi:hypothetical protein